jgi:glycosyltransferase involved in cell wall biosynthesis
MSSKTVLLLGSFAPSLVHFRGPLIAAISKSGHKVIAAAPSIAPDVAEKLRQLGAEPRELRLVNASLNPASMLQSFRQVRALVREIGPDVLIAYTIKPVILGALAGKAERVPRIVSLITGLGYAFTGGRELKRLVSRAIAAPLYRLALARSDTVIFQNRDDEALFRKLGLVASDRQTEIVNGSGIDLAHFAPAPLPERPSFLMIARLLRDKGIREFASAAKRLKADHPDVSVALVGYLDPSPDSLTHSELDDLIRHGIDYKGALSDVRQAIAEASVYVLPSYREGTPRSVLEAMSMGRAIITTDAPGCRETVEHGRNGLLIPPRDAGALYDAMRRFVSEPGLAAQMGPESRAIAKTKYDVHQVNTEMLRHAGL